MSLYKSINESIAFSNELGLFKQRINTYIDMNNKANILSMVNLLETLPMLSMKHKAFIGSLIGSDGAATLYIGIRQNGVTIDNVKDSERSKGFVAMAKDSNTALRYAKGGLLITYHIPPENIALCFETFSDIIPAKDRDEILVRLDDSVLDSCDIEIIA